MQLNMLELFAGQGGFSVAARLIPPESGVTVKTVGLCEIDPYAQQVLAKRFPDAAQFTDVRSITAESIRSAGIQRVDIIAGGFPCQDISLAGKGLGLQGERSGLYYELLRIIREVKPRFVLLENVQAIIGRGGEAVAQTLAQSGYDIEWDCISAEDAGAVHQRKRWWCIAHNPNAHCKRWWSEWEQSVREEWAARAESGRVGEAQATDSVSE